MVLVVKNSSAYEEDIRDRGFDSWVGKIPWRRACSPLQYSCLENPKDRGAWTSYSPWGHKESDTTGD